MRPDLPVIIASASKRDTEQMRKMDIQHLTNLGKPFSLEQLLIAVGMAIES
jgi:DNA-binding response OmpR family regulator